MADFVAHLAPLFKPSEKEITVIGGDESHQERTIYMKGPPRDRAQRDENATLDFGDWRCEPQHFPSYSIFPSQSIFPSDTAPSQQSTRKILGSIGTVE
mmetsp:Transcript_44199/g.106500  ORF Transcript_44199/g.106500 Transcript_44199/m.106500 type:complete len:98 (-) Transcript_44199:63-356(-)